jgi:hypothetical protein
MRAVRRSAVDQNVYTRQGGSFMNDLATASARANRITAADPAVPQRAADYRNLPHVAQFALRINSRERHCFSAESQSVTGIFKVAARYDGAIRKEHRRANAEARIRSVSVRRRLGHCSWPNDRPGCRQRHTVNRTTRIGAPHHPRPLSVIGSQVGARQPKRTINRATE